MRFFVFAILPLCDEQLLGEFQANRSLISRKKFEFLAEKVEFCEIFANFGVKSLNLTA